MTHGFIVSAESAREIILKRRDDEHKECELFIDKIKPRVIEQLNQEIIDSSKKNLMSTSIPMSRVKATMLDHHIVRRWYVDELVIALTNHYQHLGFNIKTTPLFIDISWEK